MDEYLKSILACEDDNHLWKKAMDKARNAIRRGHRPSAELTQYLARWF